MLQPIIRFGNCISHGGVAVPAAPAGMVACRPPACTGDIAGGRQTRMCGGTEDIKTPGPVVSYGATKDLNALAGGNFSGTQPAALRSVWSPSESAPAGAIRTGFGAEVDAIAAKSPSLQQKLNRLQNDGWQIQFGPAGGGSTCSRPDKVIKIDGAKMGDPVAIAQTLAHEAGHATYTPRHDFTSKNAYVRSALADEGAATLSNIQARREILANGGADIGIAGNKANAEAYNAAYDQFLRDGDENKARDTIGTIFGRGERTSNTGLAYEDYYGGWYDKTYG